MNLKAIYNSIVKDTRAVSPVVASLILVVVAVVGAATIGVMMGVVGEDVGEQADAEQVGDASKAMIELGTCRGGWDALRPNVQSFVDANTGVGVRHNRMGSRASITATSMGVTDVGIAGRGGRSQTVFDALNVSATAGTLNAAIIAAGAADGVDLALNSAIIEFIIDRTGDAGTGIPGVHRINGSYFKVRDQYNGTVNVTVHRDFARLLVTRLLTEEGDNNDILRTAWEENLVELNVQEFQANLERDGSIQPFFVIIKDDASPIEQAFMDHFRLVSFAGGITTCDPAGPAFTRDSR